MAVLKVRCPDCDTPIRLTTDPADEATELTIACPKCQVEFTADVPATKPAAKSAAKVPVKAASRRDDDDDDDDDDTPRHKRKKAAGGSNTPLIVGGIAAALLLVGGIGAAVMLSGDDKDKEQAKADPGTVAPAKTETGEPDATPQPTRPDAKSKAKSNGKSSGKSNPKKDREKDREKNKEPDRKPETVTPTPQPSSAPKKDGLIDGLVDPRLPPPPKVTLEKPAAPTGGGKLESKGDKPPPFVPIAKEEDPFLRARNYADDVTPPPLPKLPPPSQRPILTLDPGGHSAFVTNVFITPAGDQVITVSEDKAVRIWDIQTGDTVHTIRLPAGVGDEGKLLAAALSPDGKRLIVGGTPLKGVKRGAIPVFVINVETGALVRTINARDEVTSLDYSPDGNRIAVGCRDGHVQVFSANTGGKLLEVQAHSGDPVHEVRFNPHPDSKALATLGLNGTVRHFTNPAESSKSTTLNAAALRPTTIAWSQGGRFLAVGGQTGEIAVFNNNDNGRLVRTVPKHDYNGVPVRINRMQSLAGDDDIVCCGRGGGPTIGWAGVVSSLTGQVKVSFTAHNNNVFAVNVSADGKRAVSSGGNEHETCVWSTADGKILGRLSGSGNGIWGVGWAKDGKSIAFGTSNTRDENGNTPLEAVFRLDDLGPAVLPDASKYQQSVKADAVYGLQQQGEALWGIGRVKGSPRPFILQEKEGAAPEKIYTATILPGQRMAVFCGIQTLQGVDPETGRVIRNFVGHSGNILGIAPSPDGRYFVTGSSDQTIRIWNPAFEDPLLSIFVAGREWIAWTPQGYYACSAHGEQLIAWQINSGANRFPQVHTAARFRTSMYQPALIKYLVPAGRMERALAMAKRFDKVLLETTSVADIVPPEVTVDSPGPDAVVVIDQPNFTVKASAKSAKHPITAMRLLVDGRPLQGAGAVRKIEKPDVTATAEWEVTLAPGPHTFSVIAETPVARGMSKPATLTRSGEIPKPNLYVLAIGVSAYSGGGVTPLTYAASDAKLIARAFQEKSKDLFARIEVRVLTDAQATKEGMRAGMDWLKAKMTPTDVGVVSFSGHGTRDPFGRFSLVPVDATAADITGSCLSGEELKERLEKMPGRLVAILDACHAGSVAEAGGPARPDNLVRDLTSEDAGVIVLCASQGRELSAESPLTKAGFFTLGLVEGMCGHGDIDGDGLIYLNELDQYASARVRQLSNGGQNSTTGRPPGMRLFPIATAEKSAGAKKEKEKDKEPQAPMPKDKP